MKRLSALILIASLCFLSSSSFSQNQSVENLVSNGDFEGEFVSHDGEEPQNVSTDWTPWYIPPSDGSPAYANHAPFYDEETVRTRGDEEGKAQVYFNQYATHQGGIYQQIEDLTVGTRYRFSIYAWVWSSIGQDWTVSEGPGNVGVRVGIDPAGGTDATSKDIIWSTTAVFLYNAFYQYFVVAAAESTTITVFVESAVGEPVANNYIYLDDAVLEVSADNVVVDSTPTSEVNDELVQEDQEEATPTQEPTAIETATEEPTVTDEPTATDEPVPTATEAPIATEELVPTATLTSAPDKDAGASGNEVRAEEPVLPTATATSSATLESQEDATDTSVPTDTPVPTETPLPTATMEATSESVSGSEATAEPDEDDGTEDDEETPIADEFSETVVHVVVEGDTVSAIALHYDSSVDAIKRANDLNKASLIFIGLRLIVPINLPDPTPTPLPPDVPTPTATSVPPSETPVPPTATPTPTPIPTPVTYTVRFGDTLGNIAAIFGLTVQELAAANGIFNVDELNVGQVLIIPAPTPTPTSVPPTPIATSQPQAKADSSETGSTTSTSYISYTVQTGDTLDGIATQFNTTVGAIAQLNGIINPSRIFPGQVLQIPVPGPAVSSSEGSQAQLTPEPPPTPTPLPTAIPVTYTVQTGDTLFQIATNFGVSVVELAAINNITDYNRLSVGQVLTIPG